MTLTINTNIASIIAERNLDSATKKLNTSLERLSTGYKINHAADNAAGYSIADNWETQISSLDVASANALTGADLLTTAEETYKLLTSHLQRIRDLTIQAGNGTYGSASLRAIQSEVFARLQEVSRIAANSEFNGIKLMTYNTDSGAQNPGVGITDAGLNLQVGLYADANSVINLNVDLFSDASVSGLFKGEKTAMNAILTNTKTGGINTFNSDTDGYLIMSAACANLKIDASGDFVIQDNSDASATKMIGFIDNAIREISSRVTQLGAAQNRVSSALGAIDVQSQNLVSSLSTLRDTDVADESSKYVQAQILQQASATLLATANQTPSIALNLI